MGRRRADGGFTLLETLVSLALISTLMAAVGPFLVSWLRSGTVQRDQQVAIELADDAMERARSLGGADLLSGRSRVAVLTQWAQAPPAVRTAYATAMLCDWDSTISSEAPASCATSVTADPAAAGAQAPLPTVPSPVTVAGVTYQQNWYVGRCWQPTTANARCVSTASAATDLAFVRVVVAVTWTQRSCGGTCVYQTTSLVSATDDPVFNLW